MKSLAKKVLKFLRNSYFRMHRGHVANVSVNDRANGFVYVVTGSGYAYECLLSIKSLRKHNAEKVCVFSEERYRKLFEEQADYFFVIDSKIKRPKIEYVGQSPFEKSVYLDSDTFVKRNISDLFSLLERYDFAAAFCHSRKRENYSRCIKKYADIPYSFSELNSGVMVYNKSKEVLDLFAKWKKYYYDFLSHTDGWDQPSLRVSLWESDAKIGCLPPEYNLRSKAVNEKVRGMKDVLGKDHMEARVLHMHYSSNVHEGFFEIEDVEELGSILDKKALELKY